MNQVAAASNNKVDPKTSSNFVIARRLRRRLTKSLAEQQKLDASCSDKMREIISKHTRKILGIVSGLLLSYSEGAVKREDRDLFAYLSSSRISMENWLQIRREETESSGEITKLAGPLRASEAEYDRLAPLGFVSGWFGDSDEKSKIATARTQRDRLRVEKEKADTNHQVKVQAIQTSAEPFLRTSMSSDGLTMLLNQSPIRIEMKDALRLLSADVSEHWTRHVNAQVASLSDMRSATNELLSIYRADQIAKSTPLLGATNATTGN